MELLLFELPAECLRTEEKKERETTLPNTGSEVWLVVSLNNREERVGVQLDFDVAKMTFLDLADSHPAAWKLLASISIVIRRMEDWKCVSNSNCLL